MIVRHFLQWMRSAPAADRADATSALARAYLYSDLSSDDRAAAEGAMLMLLDDPSLLVRRALADALATSHDAPPTVILSLAGDHPDVAEPVLHYSPLLLDSDLVDIVAIGGPEVQSAVACRSSLPKSVAAAVAEVGCAESCLALVENAEADIAMFSFDRIVERFGHIPAIRGSLGARKDLPARVRQAIVIKLSESIAHFVAHRDGIAYAQARFIANEAREKATIALAAQSAHAENGEMRALVGHLCDTDQLTAGLILRALLCGNVALFEEALAELTDLPIERVAGIVHDPKGIGFRALFDKAGLPPSSFPAFREALAAMREDGFHGDASGVAHLKRRMVERVLTRCAEDALDVEPLMTLLRRFAAEAAREEARMFCHDLVADDSVVQNEARLFAA